MVRQWRTQKRSKSGAGRRLLGVPGRQVAWRVLVDFDQPQIFTPMPASLQLFPEKMRLRRRVRDQLSVDPFLLLNNE